MQLPRVRQRCHQTKAHACKWISMRRCCSLHTMPVRPLALCFLISCTFLPTKIIPRDLEVLIYTASIQSDTVIPCVNWWCRYGQPGLCIDTAEHTCLGASVKSGFCSSPAPVQCCPTGRSSKIGPVRSTSSTTVSTLRALQGLTDAAPELQGLTDAAPEPLTKMPPASATNTPISKGLRLKRPSSTSSAPTDEAADDDEGSSGSTIAGVVIGVLIVVVFLVLLHQYKTKQDQLNRRGDEGTIMNTLVGTPSTR